MNDSGGCVTFLRRNDFVSHCRKTLWVNIFVFHKRFGMEKSLPHSAKNYREEPSNVSQDLGYRKLSCMMGWYHDFPSKFFESQSTAKLRGGTFLCFRKFWVKKKL